MDRNHPVTRLSATPRNARRAITTTPARKSIATAIAAAFVAHAAYAAPPAPTALPSGGQIVAGQANIQQAGAAMTVHQTTNQAILNWQSFNIGASASVNFAQPGASSVALNRVLGADPSAIYGQLSANGQVFLVNPNGVLFGPGARVDVGGLVASSLAIRDADFLARNYVFTRDGAIGSVVNAGALSGQYVALLAPEVRNEGVIAARMGTVALAAGDAVTLGISGQRLVDVQVDKASIDTLVENRHLIRAEEGMVVLSAQSAHTLLGRAVNSGAIEANGLSTDGGTVRLLASSTIDHSGSIAADGAANGSGGSATLIADLANPVSRTTVSGSVSARGGSASGNGGFIETSASRLSIADSARIDAGAANGNSGLWLLDPTDFTIALAGGDITGAALGAALDLNDVTIQTSAAGGGSGDMFVNASVTWTAAKTLTMQAHRHIVVNAEINVNGGGTLLLNYDLNNGGGDYLVRAPINLSATASFQTKRETDATINYAVIRDNAALNTLALSGDLAGNYVLGTDVTATTNPWVPIGNSVTPFSGVFDGLGHVVTGVTRPNTDNATTGIGLFGQNDGMIRNLGVTNVNVAGSVNVGGLAGINSGLISNSYSTGTVTGSDVAGIGLNVGTNDDDVGSIGGLVGRNDLNIVGSYSSATVTATSGNQGTGGTLNFTQGGIGGLVGASQSPINDSYATGAVTGISDVGGLVGYSLGVISTSYSTGAVTGTNNAGGLLGFSSFFTPGLLVDTFWNTVTSGQANSANNPGSPPDFPFPGDPGTPATFSTGLDDTQIRAAASFPTGPFRWDFTNTWVIREGVSTPLLRGMLPPLFIAATAQTKVYDGAIFGGANAVTFSTPVGAKTAGAAVFGGAAAAAVNAGSHAITVSGITLASDTDQHGFLSVTPIDGTLTITQAPLTATITAANKVYNGNTTAAPTFTITSGLVGIETVTATGAATFDTKDVGTGKTVTANSNLLANGTNGGLAANYSLATGQTTTANITQAPLTASITAPNKVFDGTTTATPTFTITSGLVGVETVTATGTATFDTAAVGTGKTVTANSNTLANGTNGGLATNYSLATGQTTTANITAVAPPPDPTPTPTPTPAPTTTTEINLTPVVGTGKGDPAGTPVQRPTGTPDPTQRTVGANFAVVYLPAPQNRGNPFALAESYTQSSGYQVRVPTASVDGRAELTAKREAGNFDLSGAGKELVLPDDTFSHTRTDAVVTLEARLEDGSVLPSWLSFEKSTGRFSVVGTPPAGAERTVRVKVVATDNQGKTATTQLGLKL